MATLTFTPIDNKQNGTVYSPDYPNNNFGLCIPEVIGGGGAGETVAISWYQQEYGAEIEWEYYPNGCCYYELTVDAAEYPNAKSFYQVFVEPANNMLKVHIQLKNLSNVTWDLSHAFTCLSPVHNGHDFYDHELLRTYSGYGGQQVRLIDYQRNQENNPRPPIQFYGVIGGPDPDDIAYVEAYHATSQNRTDGYLAIRSKADDGWMAHLALNPIYTFNNMAFSCIHSAPSFGTLEPNGTGYQVSHIVIMKDEEGEGGSASLQRALEHVRFAASASTAPPLARMT